MTDTHVSLPPACLWDIAGVDGLQVMKRLLGDRCDRIAPFQSLEAEIDHIPCSILRLCEANFRLRWTGDATHLQTLLTAAASHQQVWVKQFPWLASVRLTAEMSVEQLAKIAIAKPPFSLPSLALNCAAPARINGLSCLVWRHSIQHTETIELHTARQTLHHLKITS